MCFVIGCAQYEDTKMKQTEVPPLEILKGQGNIKDKVGNSAKNGSGLKTSGKKV